MRPGRCAERDGEAGADALAAQAGGTGQAHLLPAFRVEAAPPPAPAPRMPVQDALVDPVAGRLNLPGAADIGRVLVGRFGAGHEARVRLDHGPLTGLELRVLATKRGVSAALLTASGRMRQRQGVFLKELSRRLAAHGIELTVDEDGADPAASTAPAQPPGTTR